jgi:hypothetical protein
MSPDCAASADRSKPAIFATAGLADDRKYEYRISKLETNSNEEMQKSRKKASRKACTFRISDFEFVSDFDIRISGFLDEFERDVYVTKGDCYDAGLQTV